MAVSWYYNIVIVQYPNTMASRSMGTPRKEAPMTPTKGPDLVGARFGMIEPDEQERQRDEPPARRRPGSPKTQTEDLHQVPIYMPAAVHEALKWQALVDGKSMSKWVLERIEPDLKAAAEEIRRRRESEGR